MWSKEPPVDGKIGGSDDKFLFLDFILESYLYTCYGDAEGDSAPAEKYFEASIFLVL